MRQLLRRLFLSLVFLLSGSAALFALNVPTRPEGYVSDYAGALSGAARSRLEHALRDFDDTTSNQVLVVTLPGLEGDSLEQYSIRLAEAWKPGHKGKDNGVILLVFKDDRRVRIEVGYGLEGALTDARCHLIIEHEMVPRFRAGDYDGGIERGVTAILSAIRGESQPVPRARGGNPGSLIRVIVTGLLLTQFVPTALLWVLCLAGALGLVVSLAIGTPVLTMLSGGALLLGVLSLVVRFLFPFLLVNSSGFSGRGYYRGSGGGGVWGGGFGGVGGGFSGGGGGFGGGGASGSW